MKLTRRQLRNIITEAIKSLVKVPNLTRRSLPHDFQFEPIPPEYDIDDPEILRKLQTLRSSGEGRSADSIAAALSGGSENPFGHVPPQPDEPEADDPQTPYGEFYADTKTAYDKIHDDEAYDDAGRWKPGYIEGIDSLGPEVSGRFSELGHHLEFNKHPVHGDMHNTILYKLYDDLFGRDIVRAITILEDYLTNPKYEEDKGKIEPATLQQAQLALSDMKSEKDFHFQHYFDN